ANSYVTLRDVFFFFFFFQAEDGIRDYKVTGVQTCALPISDGPRTRISPSSAMRTSTFFSGLPTVPILCALGLLTAITGDVSVRRSEERRVGKECRARWARDT